MEDIMRRIIALVMKNKAGATAIEYGLIAALVSVAAIGALEAMGGSLNQMFGTVDTELQDAVAAGTGTGTDTGGTDTGGTDGGTDGGTTPQ
jgi:pilus assembly protein Flp/PilA